MWIASAGFIIRRGRSALCSNQNLRYLCFLSPSIPWPCRSLGIQNNNRSCHETKNQTPWLMLSSPTAPDARLLCEFKTDDDVGSKIKVKVKGEIQLPEFAGDHCIGLSHGFVFSVPTCCSPNVVAFNPLTAERLPLPPTADLPHIPRHRSTGWDASNEVGPGQLADLVKPGTNEKVTVDFNYDSFFQGKALLSPSLAFAVLLRRTRPQSHVDIHFTHLSPSLSSTWLPLPISLKFIEDCIFHRGHLILVNSTGAIATYKDTGDILNPISNITCHELELDPTLCYKYLVESPSGDDLFFVCRGFPLYCRYSDAHGQKQPEKRGTGHFVVFRLEKNGRYRWKQVDSLQGLAFFVGPAASVSVCAADCPGVVPDCIYFADDVPLLDYLTSDGTERVGDTGVYNMRDKTIRFLLFRAGDVECELNWPPPSWIVSTVSGPHQPSLQTGAKESFLKDAGGDVCGFLVDN